MKCVPAIVASFLLVPSLAFAEGDAPDHQFGERGQYLVTSDSRLDVRTTSVTYVDDLGNVQTNNHIEFDGRVAIDKVVWPRITVGLSAGFQSEVLGTESLNSLLLGTRFGYIIDISKGEDLSLWARLGLVYANNSYRLENGSGLTYATVRATASLPLVWRPVKRFFLGGGPMIEREIYAAAGPDVPLTKHTSFVVQGMIGGWFHGY